MCSHYNPYGVVPQNFSEKRKESDLRANGGTLQIPFLYGPKTKIYKSKGTNPEKNFWQIGSTIRMTPAIPETKTLFNYFYEEKIVTYFSHDYYYNVQAPKIRVFVIKDTRVIKNIAILLKAIQNKFTLNQDEIKNVQIAPGDYLKEILNTPSYNFKVNFLYPSDHNKIYITKAVRFYNRQK